MQTKNEMTYTNDYIFRKINLKNKKNKSMYQAIEHAQNSKIFREIPYKESSISAVKKINKMWYKTNATRYAE